MSSPSSTCPKCGFQFSMENYCPKCGTASPTYSSGITQNVPSSTPTPGAEPNRMNKKPILIAASAIGAIIVIMIIGYSVNTYALSNLQFRSMGGDNFDFTTFSANMQVEACNPTSVPASFDKYHMEILYKEQEFATMDIEGGTVNPSQSTTLDGNVAIDRGMIASLVLQGLADALSGEQTSEFNQDDMTVHTSLEAKVLGFMPYTESKTYTMKEFQDLSQNPSSYSCS